MAYRIVEIKKGKKKENTFYEIEKEVSNKWFNVGPAGDDKKYAEFLKKKFEEDDKIQEVKNKKPSKSAGK